MDKKRGIPRSRAPKPDHTSTVALKAGPWIPPWEWLGDLNDVQELEQLVAFAGPLPSDPFIAGWQTSDAKAFSEAITHHLGAQVATTPTMWTIFKVTGRSPEGFPELAPVMVTRASPAATN